MNLVITIAGAHGTGKTTIGKKLSEHFGLQYNSAGQIFRKMAQEQDMTCSEFNEYACDNPEIDKDIDNRTKNLAKTGNVVLDGTLSAWLTHDISTINILFTTPLEIRIERIAERDKLDLDKAKEETLEREQLEKNRFKELYNINITDYSIYDIIINTHTFDINSIMNILITAIEEIKDNNDSNNK
ncbi:MAG: cytidylate kinase [Promethearchaeota archaeon]|nr:MAG: cytidylate kinase [Candidatus Lokiarchaeota archaeon]